uniref:Uncharacterized mitochondrial protein AtMg00810-like n=1 Tax=Tanacetum cinerariifolium TaxID=118510 RepID=A0A6L2NE96_TANCI|nr:uncharacterized mitochondrial protein AtMg00810-like [Tanacetum cinerariifolium]
MRRVGKGFSGVETPIFEGMLAVRQPAGEEVAEAQVQVDAAVAAAVRAHVAEDVSHDAIPSPPPYVIPSPSQAPSSHPQQQQSSPQAPPQDAEFPTQLQQVLNARVKKLEKDNKIKSSKLRRLRKVRTSRRVESSDDMDDVFNQGRMITDMNEGIKLVKDAEVAESKGRNVAEHAEKQAKIYNFDLDHSLKVLSMQEDDSEVSAASTTIPAASATIPAAAPTIIVAYTRRKKGVIIRDPEEELPLKTPAETPKEAIGDTTTLSQQELDLLFGPLYDEFFNTAKGYAQEKGIVFCPIRIQIHQSPRGLWYPKDSGFKLTAFLDAGHARCIDTHKSTFGGIQFLGDKLVSWMSKKQDFIAMSSVEALTEYQLADMFTKALPKDRF